MKYAHIIHAVNSMPWAIMPSKLAEITGFLEFAAGGGVLDKEAVRAQFNAETSDKTIRSGAVAVIPMRGVISQRTNMMSDYSGGVSVDKLTKSFREAMDDDSVGSIVFDIDSPGGGVPGVPEFADEVYNSRDNGKRIVAVANHQMCSAALWIGSAAHEVVVIPSGEAGCRGVMAAHVDVSKFEEMIGQKTTLIVSDDTPLKNSAHPYKPLSDEDLAAIQKDVNYYADIFAESYARNRGVSLQEVKEGHGRGATLPAKFAVEAGIADRVATLEEVIAGLLQPDARARGRRLRASRLRLLKGN